MSSKIVERIEALRAKALKCAECPLAETRTQVVFGDGNAEAPLVIVGEGPGESEDRLGRPFVGRAGHLLDECLAECGMNRSHVWITNIVKCRACVVENGRVSNRPPRVEEVTACKPIIMAELASIGPLVILCLGGPAANLLIHKNFRITRERGIWFTNTPYAQCVLAALHPAYVLRQYGGAQDNSRELLVADLESARRKVIELKAAIMQGELVQGEPRPVQTQPGSPEDAALAESDVALSGEQRSQMSLF